MEKKLTGVLVDVVSKKVDVVHLDQERELDELYRVLNCDTIDIVVRDIGGRKFDIVCDDEGFLKDPIVVSAVNMADGSPALVGNLFICSHEGPELKSLDRNELLTVMMEIWDVADSKSVHPVVMLG